MYKYSINILLCTLLLISCTKRKNLFIQLPQSLPDTVSIYFDNLNSNKLKVDKEGNYYLNVEHNLIETNSAYKDISSLNFKYSFLGKNWQSESQFKSKYGIEIIESTGGTTDSNGHFVPKFIQLIFIK